MAHLKISGQSIFLSNFFSCEHFSKNDAYKYFYIFLFKKGNYIVNWITMTRKYGEHLRMTYGNTGQLFQPY